MKITRFRSAKHIQDAISQLKNNLILGMKNIQTRYTITNEKNIHISQKSLNTTPNHTRSKLPEIRNDNIQNHKGKKPTGEQNLKTVCFH